MHLGVVYVCVQSCLTLSDPMDCSPPGSSVHGILQARIVKWVAMPSSRESSRPMDQTQVSYASSVGRRVFYHYVESLLLLEELLRNNEPKIF